MMDKAYYESLDKRTKEFKEWKANFEKENTKVLGDAVEAVTKATGIKKLVETFTPEGKDCGCDKRKEKLNDLPFSYKVLECPTEEQFLWMKDYIENTPNKNKVTGFQQDQINSILSHVYKRRFSRINCCFGIRIDAIKKLYNSYL